MDLKLIIIVEKKGELIESHIFDDLDKADIFLRNLKTEIASGRLMAEIKVFLTDLTTHF